MVVVRELYGLKSFGALLRSMFCERLSEMNFVPFQTDTDVYQRRSQKANGEDYYELLLVYINDVLTCYHEYQAIMDDLALIYDLKEG